MSYDTITVFENIETQDTWFLSLISAILPHLHIGNVTVIYRNMLHICTRPKNSKSRPSVCTSTAAN